MSQWISNHLFYSIDQRGLLLDCIQPLVGELKAAGLIEQFFFIRYWENGPHIRLRVKAVHGAENEVKRLMEPPLSEFLSRKATRFILPDNVTKFWPDWYVLEYGKEALLQKYPSGVIPRYPENTFRYIDYEPEYARYGGEAGMQISERHFERSSRVVLDRLSWPNMQNRGIRDAQNIQLMLDMCFAFLDTEEAVAKFCLGYASYWFYQFFAGKPGEIVTKVLPTAELLLGKVRTRIRKAAQDLQNGTTRIIPRQDVEYYAHCKQLKAELDRIASDAVPVPTQLPLQDGETEVRVARDPLIYLLTSYVHMTNNRLGATLRDEVNMSYVIYRALSSQDVLRQGGGMVQ